MEKYKTTIYLLLFTIYQIINENEQNLCCYQNPMCPVELAEGIPGVAIMDNDAFREDTLAGILLIND